PKKRGRAAARPPLKELGVDPATKLSVVIKDGRFGPYATDGDTNASLRKTDTIEDITIDRASELLAERRAKAPTAKKAAKKTAKKATKKAAAKKSTKKKTAAKKTVKKAAKKAPEKKTGDPRHDDE
ncbi:MAG: topoisomerase C-terminal repeat-containing protein, partial [Stackebrandtia sp.]